MRTLYVVTHPEATHQVKGLVGGWYDSDLTLTGDDHARRIAEALVERIPAKQTVEVYSSDLRRTRQTAGPIAGRFHVAVVVDPGLREQSFGDAEGKPVGSVHFEPPPAHGDRLHHRDGVEGSETKWEVALRVYAALDRVLASPASHQVVVTHEGPGTFLIAHWIGMPIEAAGRVDFVLPPGSITVLAEDEVHHHRQVALLGDLSHLRRPWPGRGEAQSWYGKHARRMRK